MKRIRMIQETSTQFDEVKNPVEWESDRVDYLACVRQVIRAPMNPQAGVQLDEMEKGLRVLKALFGLRLGDLLALEDADWQHLCDKIRTTRWSLVDERLVRFMHSILNASEWPADATDGEKVVGG